MKTPALFIIARYECRHTIVSWSFLIGLLFLVGLQLYFVYGLSASLHTILQSAVGGPFSPLSTNQLGIFDQSGSISADDFAPPKKSVVQIPLIGSYLSQWFSPAPRCEFRFFDSKASAKEALNDGRVTSLVIMTRRGGRLRLKTRGAKPAYACLERIERQILSNAGIPVRAADVFFENYKIDWRSGKPQADKERPSLRMYLGALLAAVRLLLAAVFLAYLSCEMVAIFDKEQHNRMLELLLSGTSVYSFVAGKFLGHFTARAVQLVLCSLTLKLLLQTSFFRGYSFFFQRSILGMPPLLFGAGLLLSAIIYSSLLSALLLLVRKEGALVLAQFALFVGIPLLALLVGMPAGSFTEPWTGYTYIPFTALFSQLARTGNDGSVDLPIILSFMSLSVSAFASTCLAALVLQRTFLSVRRWSPANIIRPLLSRSGRFIRRIVPASAARRTGPYNAALMVAREEVRLFLGTPLFWLVLMTIVLLLAYPASWLDSGEMKAKERSGVGIIDEAGILSTSREEAAPPLEPGVPRGLTVRGVLARKQERPNRYFALLLPPGASAEESIAIHSLTRVIRIPPDFLDSLALEIWHKPDVYSHSPWSKLISVYGLKKLGYDRKHLERLLPSGEAPGTRAKRRAAKKREGSIIFVYLFFWIVGLGAFYLSGKRLSGEKKDRMLELLLSSTGVKPFYWGKIAGGIAQAAVLACLLYALAWIVAMRPLPASAILTAFIFLNTVLFVALGVVLSPFDSLVGSETIDTIILVIFLAVPAVLFQSILASYDPKLSPLLASSLFLLVPPFSYFIIAFRSIFGTISGQTAALLWFINAALTLGALWAGARLFELGVRNPEVSLSQVLRTAFRREPQ